MSPIGRRRCSRSRWVSIWVYAEQIIENELLGTEMRRGRLYVRRFGVQSDFNWDSMFKKPLASGGDSRYDSRTKVSSSVTVQAKQIQLRLLLQATFPTRTNQKFRRITDTKFITDVLLIPSLSRLSFKSCKIAASLFFSLLTNLLSQNFLFRLFLCWLEYCWSFSTSSGTSTKKTIFTYLNGWRREIS